MTMRRLLRILLLASLALPVACATRYQSAALGQYERFEPYARLRNVSIDLELSRDAYIAIIAIRAPSPGFRDRPVLYRPLYPLYPTDPVRFAAGRHRLVARRTTLVDPLNCRRDEVPTLDGCRRPAHLYPGVGGPGDVGTVYSSTLAHYIVIASEEYIDPFTLADELFNTTLERPELASVLRRLDANASAQLLEQALLDRPGTPIWGAFYVTSS
jgi:hypothetical protein